MAGGRGAHDAAGGTPGRAGGRGTLPSPVGLGTIPDPTMKKGENRAQEGGNGWLMEAGEVRRVQRSPPRMPIVIQVKHPSHKV